MNRSFFRALFSTVAIFVLAYQTAYGQSALRLTKGTDYTYSGLVPRIGNAIPDVSNWSWLFSIKPYGSSTLDSDASDALFSTGTNSATNPTQGGYSFTVPAASQAPLTASNYKLTVYANGTGMVGKISGGTLSVTIPVTSAGSLDLTPSLGGISTDTALDTGQTTTLGQIMTGVNNTNATLGNVGNGVTATNTNLNNAITQLNNLQSSVNALASATPSPSPTPVPNKTSGPFPDGLTLHPIPGTWSASDYDFGTPANGSAAAYFANAGTASLTYRSDSGNANLKTNTDTISASPWRSGTTAVVGTLATNSYMVYSCAVATTRTYDIQMRVQTNFTTAKVHVEADGVAITGSVVVPQTFTSQTWDVSTNWATLDLGNVTLTAKAAGVSTAIKVVVDNEFFDINEIAFINSTVTGSTIATSAFSIPAVASTGVASVSGTAPTVGQWVKGGNATLQVTAVGSPTGGLTPVTLFNGDASGNSGVTSLPVGTTLAVQGATPTSGMYFVAGTGGPYVYGLAIPPTDPRVLTAGSTGPGGVTWTLSQTEPQNVANNPSQPVNPGGKPELWVAARTDNAAGTGSASDPYNWAGTTNGAAADRITAFWKNTAPSNTIVHVAKGTYHQYRGYNDFSGNTKNTKTTRPGNWVLCAGQNHTLFVAEDPNLAGETPWVWGSNDQDDSGFQLWDCTTDCSAHTAVDLRWQGGFIHCNGSNVRIERCRGINYGTHGRYTDTAGTDIPGAEMFLAGAYGGAPGATTTNWVMDRCIIELPDPVHVHLTDGITLIHADASNMDQATCYVSNCRTYDNLGPFSYSHMGTVPRAFGNYMRNENKGFYMEPNGGGNQTNNCWIHDNYYDGIERAWFILWSGVTNYLTGNIIFEHNTAVLWHANTSNAAVNASANGMTLTGPGPQLAQVHIRDNVFTITGPSYGLRLPDPTVSVSGNTNTSPGLRIGTFEFSRNKMIGINNPTLFDINRNNIASPSFVGNTDGNGNPLTVP